MTPEEQREVSRCIFREANDGFLVVDPVTQRILEVNPAAQRLTGYRRRVLLEMSVDDVLICEESAQRELLSAACRSTKFATCCDTCQIITATGKKVEVQTHACRIHTESRSLGLFVVRDISRQRAAEAAKRELETQFHESRRMQSLGVMASGIAHDLNNQLLGMIGNAELLLRHIPDTDPLHANLVEITTAAHKTAKLTDNLLVYANTAPRERQVVSIEKLIQRAISRLDVSIRRKFELRINAEPSVLGRVSDPVEIEQAIQNLVINAAEAIKLAGRKHGQVHIDVCQVQVGEGSGTRLAIGPYAEIIVKDNGNGISAEALPFVFDPFFSSKLPGRGLGLAVAHSAMLMNGGLIQVRSQPGSGSEFRILLPAAAQKLQGGELETANQSELD